jgi:hypothetical protein
MPNLGSLGQYLARMNPKRTENVWIRSFDPNIRSRSDFVDEFDLFQCEKWPFQTPLQRFDSKNSDPKFTEVGYNSCKSRLKSIVPLRGAFTGYCLGVDCEPMRLFLDPPKQAIRSGAVNGVRKLKMNFMMYNTLNKSFIRQISHSLK